MWREFQDSIPPHLLELTGEVKQTVFASKAAGTVRTYMGGFNSWKRWDQSNGLAHLPAHPFHVAMYLQVLLQSASSASPIHNAVYSVDWAHGLAGFPKVSSHCMVQSMMRKEPITPLMLQQLAEKLKDKSCIANCRTLALCLIGFAGFLRFSELCSLRTCDVRLYASHCCLFLECSKTYQLREGAWIHIARSGQETCPVAALENYLTVAGIQLDDDSPLFRALAPP